MKKSEILERLRSIAAERRFLAMQMRDLGRYEEISVRRRCLDREENRLRVRLARGDYEEG